MEALLSTLEKTLAQGHLVAFVMVFIGGILTSFTPCIYPMIPITISIVGGQKQHSRLQSWVRWLA
jgi:thiol:disulfide interchange protein